MLTGFKHNVRVMGWFFVRDMLTFLRHAPRITINFCIIVPIAMTIAFGYILPNSNLINPTPEQVTIFFAGSILWTLFPVAFLLNYDLLYDFEHDRFINYQMIVLNPTYILIEKWIFSAAITFCVAMPFYPISSLLLGHYFYASQISWFGLFAVLGAGALFCSAFNIFFVSFIESTKKTGIFWMRINHPMISLGGLFIPWFVMRKVSWFIGMVSLLNPLLYCTEGIRRAILANKQFFSLPLCFAALSAFSMLFIWAAIYFFKKKTDHI